MRVTAVKYNYVIISIHFQIEAMLAFERKFSNILFLIEKIK